MKISKAIILPILEKIESFEQVQEAFEQVIEAIRDHNLVNYDDEMELHGAEPRFFTSEEWRRLVESWGHNWSTLPDDGHKPNDDADVTGEHTAFDMLNLPATPDGAGLYVDDSHLGYYDGSNWQAYIGNDGKFYFKGDDDNFIQWTGTNFEVKGLVSADALSAFNANLGTITAGNITLDDEGFIRTTGKDNYADDTAGLWFGYDTDKYKLNIGDATNYLKWTGTKLELAGDMTAGIIDGAEIKVGGTGSNQEIYFKDSGIYMYDFLSGYEENTKGIALKYSTDVFFDISWETNHCYVRFKGSSSDIFRIWVDGANNSTQLSSGHGDHTAGLYLKPGGDTNTFYMWGTGQFQLPNLGSDPTGNLAAGQLAIVSNVLRIYSGSSWSNV